MEPRIQFQYRCNAESRCLQADEPLVCKQTKRSSANVPKEQMRKYAMCVSASSALRERLSNTHLSKTTQREEKNKKKTEKKTSSERKRSDRLPQLVGTARPGVAVPARDDNGGAVKRTRKKEEGTEAAMDSRSTHRGGLDHSSSNTSAESLQLTKMARCRRHATLEPSQVVIPSADQLPQKWSTVYTQ